MPRKSLMQALWELCEEVYARGFNDSNPVGELTEEQEAQWQNRRAVAIVNALDRAGLKV